MNDVEYDYWAKFYRRFDNSTPTPFCLWALPRMKGSVVFDLGCGNGRDTEKIAEILPVMDVDPHAPSLMAEFRYHQTTVEDFIQLVPCSPHDTVYARWFFHAITEAVEDKVLDWCKGQLFVEARVESVNVLDNHYRRPLDPAIFAAKLIVREFEIDYLEVQQGWSKVGEDDPWLMRVEAHR